MGDGVGEGFGFGFDEGFGVGFGAGVLAVVFAGSGFVAYNDGPDGPRSTERSTPESAPSRLRSL